MMGVTMEGLSVARERLAEGWRVPAATEDEALDAYHRLAWSERKDARGFLVVEGAVWRKTPADVAPVRIAEIEAEHEAFPVSRLQWLHRGLRARTRAPMHAVLVVTWVRVLPQHERRGWAVLLYQRLAERVAGRGFGLANNACRPGGCTSVEAEGIWRKLEVRYPSMACPAEEVGERCVLVWGGAGLPS